MRKARSGINLSEAGITDMRVRRSLAGGIILEIPGKSNVTKASDLAGRLGQIFPIDRDVRVSRLIKMAEMRVALTTR